MFSSIPGLYPGDARSSPHPNCDNQDRHCQMSPGDSKSSWVENHCLKPQPDSMPTSPDASHSFQMPTAHPHLLSTLAQMIPKHSRCCSHSLCRHHDLSDVSPLSHDKQGGPLLTQPSVPIPWTTSVSIPTSPLHSEVTHFCHLPCPPPCSLLCHNAHLEVAS